MRALDWSATPLGPVALWPQSLRTTVSIALGTPSPMMIAWGSELSMLYNDGYVPVLGPRKHPRALGRRLLDCFAEIRDLIGPLFRGVMQAGEAVGACDMMFPIERQGFPEESYLVFSYSPIRDESGRVGGVLTTCTDTTARVIGERRLRTLRALADGTGIAATADGALERAARTLDPADVPFALLYLLEAEGACARLVATAGVAAGTPASPVRVHLHEDGSTPWPLRAVATSRRAELAGPLAPRFGSLPGGPWPEPSKQALVLPLARPGLRHPYGVLVAGISPRQPFDDACRAYLELVAEHVATAVANASAREEQLRQARADLQRAHLQALFTQAPTPICVLQGRQLRVELANDPWCELWRRSREQVQGHALLDVLPEVQGRVFHQHLQDVLASGEPHVGRALSAELGPESARRRAHFNFVYSPLRDLHGQVDGVLAIGFDVTDEVRARDELARTVHYNELFTGILAHDLRNPLSAIVCGAQLLLHRTDDERIALPAQRILASGDRMSRMIAQLLDFTRLRLGGGLHIERQALDLAELARRCLGEVEAATGERRFQLDATGDASGRWDGDRLAQVLSNLAGNAAQHGAPDAPLRVRIDGREPDRVTLEFENGGVIPLELLPSLFEPFRGTTNRRRNANGLGLGLYISRAIALAHGGELRVASSREAGTRFTLVLPRGER